METTTFTSFGRPFQLSTLDNGFTVVTAPDDRTVGLDCRYVIKTGAQTEPMPGISHFLEHILFEGPSRNGAHPKLRKLILAGADANASTDDFTTDYNFTGHIDMLEDAIRALCTLCAQPSFNDADVEQERNVILEETRIRSQTSAFLLWQHCHLFPNHLRLHATIGGTPFHIQAIGTDDLRAYHNETYVAANAMLIASGNITHERVVNAVTSQVQLSDGKALPRPKCILPRIGSWTCTLPGQKPRVYIYVRRPDTELESYKANMVLSALADFVFGPIVHELRRKEGVVYKIDRMSYVEPYNFIGLIIEAPQKKLRFVQSRVLAHIDHFRRDEIGEEAIMRIIAERRLRHLKRSEKTPDKLLNQIIGDWCRRGLSDDDIWPAIIETTRQDLVETAGRYFKPEQIGTIIVDPDNG